MSTWSSSCDSIGKNSNPLNNQRYFRQSPFPFWCFFYPLYIFLSLFFPPLFIALVKSGQYSRDAANQEWGGLHQRGAGQGAGGSQAQLPAAGTSAGPLASSHPEPRPQSSHSPAAAASTAAATTTQTGREHEAAAGCDQHAHHWGAARFWDAVCKLGRSYCSFYFPTDLTFDGLRFMVRPEI